MTYPHVGEETKLSSDIDFEDYDQLSTDDFVEADLLIEDLFLLRGFSQDNTTVPGETDDTPCKVELIGDKTCNLQCLTAEFAFDLGDCCPKFKKFQLSDGDCSEGFNVEECAFDGGDCNSNIDFCVKELEELKELEEPKTIFDLPSFCSTFSHCTIASKGDCDLGKLGDDFCDSACNNDECFNDMGDCKLGPGLLVLQVGFTFVGALTFLAAIFGGILVFLGDGQSKDAVTLWDTATATVTSRRDRDPYSTNSETFSAGASSRSQAGSHVSTLRMNYFRMKHKPSRRRKRMGNGQRSSGVLHSEDTNFSRPSTFVQSDNEVVLMNVEHSTDNEQEPGKSNEHYDTGSATMSSAKTVNTFSHRKRKHQTPASSKDLENQTKKSPVLLGDSSKTTRDEEVEERLDSFLKGKSKAKELSPAADPAALDSQEAEITL